jgi:toxin CcdB
MAQFDVHKNTAGGGLYPLLLDIQADALSRIGRRIVVPMVLRRRYGGKAIPRLNPVVSVRGSDYVLVFQDLASIPRTALGERVDSLANRRAELIAAVDLLFTGI